MAELKPENRQYLDSLFEQHGLTDPQTTAALSGFLDDDAKIDKLRSDMENFTQRQPRLYNTEQTLDSLYTYATLSADTPKSVRMENYNYINRQKVRESNGGLSYLDTIETLQKNSAERNQFVKDELDHQTGKQLLTSYVPVLDDENAATYLSDVVQSLNQSGQDFKSIIIPVAAKENNIIRSMTLILDPSKKSAQIYDQADHTHLQKSKTNISNMLAKVGYTKTTSNQYPLSQHKPDPFFADSFFFTSLIADQAVAGSLDDFINRYSAPETTQEQKDAEIKAQFQADQQTAKFAYLLQYTDHPLFRLYVEARGKDLNKLTIEECRIFASEFKLIPQEQIAHLEEIKDRTPDSSQDWKEKFDQIFQAKAAANNRQFTRTDTEQDPFLSYENPEAKVKFPDRHTCQIASDKYTDFLISCQTLKEAGHTKAKLGEFKDHPEYRAKYYLACLESGLEVVNAPELETLRQYPEFEKINRILNPVTDQKEVSTDQKAVLTAKIKSARDAVNQARAEAYQDTDGYLKLNMEFTKADRQWKQDKRDPEAKAARQKAEQALYDPDGCPKGYALKQAQDAYQQVMKDAIQFYIDNGNSQDKDGNSITADQRRQKLEQHLQKYDAYHFFATEKKDQDGNPIPATDREGKPVVDKDGKPVMKTERNMESFNKYQAGQQVLKNFIKPQKGR